MKTAIIGPGNIGSDLMYKILKNPVLEIGYVAGIIESEGIRRAKGLGIPAGIDGIGPILENPEIELVFDATSAAAHKAYAPMLRAAGKRVIDLTPAAIGPYVVPTVNYQKINQEQEFNMVTCGGQATIPIVAAINQAAGVEYAEIVSCISSKSAGPGTRANIDEFTVTTAKALEEVGRAKKGKAIIILNPADPPIMMTNTIYTLVEKPDEEKIRKSVMEMVERVRRYVPGYELRTLPILTGNQVTVIVQVTGAGDFLPVYAGNLDIINSAAVAVAEKIARKESKAL